MSAKSQVAYMLIANDSEQLKSELATTVGWPRLLGLPTDVRIGKGAAATTAAAAGIGATRYWRGAGTAAVTVTAAAAGAAV